MGISGAAVRGLSAVVAAVVLASACSTPEQDAETSADDVTDAVAEALADAEPDATTEEDSESPTTTKQPDPRARAAVKAAVLELLRANTGTYELSIPLGSGASIRERGSYRIDPSAHEIVRTLGSPEGTIRVVQRTVGDQQWVRLDSLTSDDGQETEGWPCWVSLDDVARIPDSPLPDVAGPEGQPPAAVVSASYAMGRRRLGAGSLDGTTDLALALSLLGGKAVLASGVDPQGDATVPAAFRVTDGTLAEVAVRMDDVLPAVEAAGGTVAPELEGLDLAPGRMTTRFTDVGSEVDVVPPPADELLAFGGPEDFEAAMASCGSS